MTRVLVADSNEVARRGLRHLLSSTADMSVVAEAADASQTMACVAAGGLDLVVLDMNVPGCSGIELVRRIKAQAPALPVLALAVQADWQIASRAIRAGAGGYLTKSSPLTVLTEAIRKVGSGENYIEPGMAMRIAFRGGANAANAKNEELSDREYEVLVSLAQGKSLTEIGNELHLSAKTVSTHKARLMTKLGLGSLSELVRYALRRGIVD